MGRIDQLLAAYKRHVELPLRPNLPFSQRVWFLVYSPDDERRMANRVTDFEIATREAKLAWRQFDLSGLFADWLDSFDKSERDSCLADPELVEAYSSPGFRDHVCDRVAAVVKDIDAQEAERTVLAITGLMELYDFVHVSTVVEALAGRHFPGVLLLFFPGEREGSTYRFLGARTGWDYLAVPILAES